jgi:hypothetical protein
MTTAQDGGKVVSLKHRPPLPPGNTPGTHFCQRLSRPQSHSATGRIMSLKNSNDTIGNRTRDMPVCSVVPQPLRHRAPPVIIQKGTYMTHVEAKRNALKILVYRRGNFRNLSTEEVKYWKEYVRYMILSLDKFQWQPLVRAVIPLYLLTYSMEQSPSWEDNWFCS